MTKKHNLIMIIFIVSLCILNVTCAAAPDIKVPEPISILVSAVGDCTLGNNDIHDYKNSFINVFYDNNKDYNYFFNNVKHIFNNDDLSIVNLETTLTNAQLKMNKQFTFKGSPEFTKILKAGGIEAVNISNNHIHDYLTKGFVDTVNNLKKSDIGYFGEGYLYTKTIKGIKLGLAGYRGWTFSDFLKGQIKRDINTLKKQQVKLIIISFHWGVESMSYPNVIQQNLAKYAIDCGADLVLGHHPHVIEGIELYRGKYIVYSMGNFCYGGSRYVSDKDTFVFQQNFTFSNIKLNRDTYANIIPCSISSIKARNNFQPTILEGNDKLRVINRMNTYSKDFGITISDDGFIQD